MAKWQKIIVSGSDAELNSLKVGISQSITTSPSTTFLSGSFSGSFQGDGSGLTNIPASGIQGLNLSQIATGSVTASVDINGDIFKITSGSNTLFKLKDNGGLECGSNVTASGDFSHAEGEATQAIGNSSHAEGTSTITYGNYSHAEGETTIAIGISSHAEGLNTVSSGSYSHAEGTSTQAIGESSHAEGNATIASGSFSHAEGENSQAIGYASHAEGANNQALGNYSHAEGDKTKSFGNFSHTEGYNSITGHKEIINQTPVNNTITISGDLTSLYTPGSKVFVTGMGELSSIITSSNFNGTSTIITIENLQNIPYVTIIYLYKDGSGLYSHAEGHSTFASGSNSHAEGQSTQAIGNGSHAEGNSTQAIGNFSHAEGVDTQAIGISSHAEGEVTKAVGQSSHAEGVITIASSSYSHAEGIGTITNENTPGQHAEGKYNINTQDALLVIGNGIDNANRSNLAEFYTSSVIFNSAITASSFSGSFYGDGTGLTGISATTASNITPAITSGNVNNNVLTANGDGTVTGESNLTFDGSKLTITGDAQVNNLTVTKDLIVIGTASFQETTNVTVADRFVLLASGSNSSGSGGIVVQQNTQGIGEAIGYNSPTNRWGLTSSFDATQPSFTPSSMIVTAEYGNSMPANPTYGGSGNGFGNIFVSSSGDIFIYA